MRFAILGLLLPVFLGCAGKNTVAGEDKTNAEKLEAAAPSWCAAACKHLEACPQTGDCDCSGDVCDCPSGVNSSCAADCTKSMKAFTRGDDYCASVGERFRQCVDDAGCSVLSHDGACTPTMGELAACPDDNIPTPSDSSSDGTAGTATAGSASGPSIGPGVGDNSSGPSAGGASASGGSSGTAGTAMGGVGASGPGSVTVSVSCMDGWGTAGASSGPPPSSLVICEAGVDGCTDGHQYSWLCAEGSQKQTACSCLVDSQVTGGFDPGGPMCPTRDQLNAGCGWSIVSGI